MAEALLTVSDARCAGSGRPTVIKAYKSVRGNAGKHITAALPRVGALVQHYAGLSGALADVAQPGYGARPGQFGQLLDAAGWQLAEVTVLPSGQSLLNASAR